MKRKIVIASIGVLLLLLILGGVKAMQIRAMVAMGKSMPAPSEPVTSAKVREEIWQPRLAAVASISAVQGVMISSELAGTVKDIAFESGATVNKGDLLVQMDISAEEAQLRSAEADAQLALLEMDRARDLQAKKVISKAEWDLAEAKTKRATAQVDNIRSVIAKKTITAPFAGRTGIRQVNLGQGIEAGAGIVSLQSLDPVFIDFSLPQQNIAALEKGMQVRLVTDAYPDKMFPATLTAINPNLDAATRTVTLQATADNPEHLLRAGMFAKIEVLLPTTKPVLVIPTTAVSYAPYGDSVFVIETKRDEKTGKEELSLRQQIVKLGSARGDLVAVESGLKVGDQVATSGVFKLRNGLAVTIDNDLAPDPQLAPKPSDS